jgi:hypothetical protein
MIPDSTSSRVEEPRSPADRPAGSRDALRITLRVAPGAALLLWNAFAFWLFSFSFSSGFFEYNLRSRLPTFLAAFFAAVAIPLSAAVQWRRARRTATTRLGAGFAHAIVTALSIAPLTLASAILSRAPSPWRLEADDAMGVGIDFMMLLGIALTSLIVLAVTLAFTRPSPSGGRGAPEEGRAEKASRAQPPDGHVKKSPG